VPTYVYECKSCRHQFEAVHKINEEPVKECPECKGEVMRLLFPPAIVFKGSGFHVNDYPSSGYQSPSGNGKKAESATESKTETKTETADSKV